MAEQSSNRFTTTLGADITSGATSLSVPAIPAGLVTGTFSMVIGSELVRGGTLSGSGPYTISGLTRGDESAYGGGAAAAHSAGDRVSFALTRRALLQLISENGGGGSISEGALGSRPAAGTAGRLYLPTDAPFISEDTGAAWLNWGPLYPMADVPTLTDPASTGGTTDTTYGGLRLLAAGTASRYRGKSVPATPYTIKALVHLNSVSNNNGDRCGLYWRDSVGGHIIRCSLEWINSGSPAIYRFNTYENSDPSTFVGSLGSSYQAPALQYSPYAWLLLTDDGSTKKFLVAPDGFHIYEVFSTTHAGTITPDQVGFYVQATSASDVYGWLQSWQES